NHMAVVMSAARKDANGDIDLELKDLPPGVKAQAFRMPGNQSSVPVLLTAAADTPLAGSLTDTVPHLSFKRGDQELDVTGHLSQTSGLVRVNQATMYGYT